jgi:H+/Cl- antiporter ClcA
VSEARDQKHELRTLGAAFGLAFLIGIPAAAAALLFMGLIETVQETVFEHLPHELGIEGLPGWWVVAVTTAGALLVALAYRLPGGGGHSPLEGISVEDEPHRPLGPLTVALASLGFGAVLGPEMPLLLLGQWLGVVAADRFRGSPPVRRLAALSGAASALGVVFGNPATAMVVLLEAARGTPVLVLLPPFVAAAVGFSIFTGIGSFGGLPAESLAVPALPVYEQLELWHVAASVLLAFVAGGLVVAIRLAGGRVHRVAALRPTAVLVASGVTIGLLAVLFRELTDEPVDLVLFSGTETLPETIALTSIPVVLGLLAAKGLAYALCLGSGFRGGPIFPAIALGIALAVVAHLLVDDLPLTAAFVAASAAAGAAQMQLPFAGAILALLLAGNAGANTVALAAVGATVGFLVRLIADRYTERDAATVRA